MTRSTRDFTAFHHRLDSSAEGEERRTQRADSRTRVRVGGAVSAARCHRGELVAGHPRYADGAVRHARARAGGPERPLRANAIGVPAAARHPLARGAAGDAASAEAQRHSRRCSVQCSPADRADRAGSRRPQMPQPRRSILRGRRRSDQRECGPLHSKRCRRDGTPSRASAEHPRHAIHPKSHGRQPTLMAAAFAAAARCQPRDAAEAPPVQPSEVPRRPARREYVLAAARHRCHGARAVGRHGHRA